MFISETLRLDDFRLSDWASSDLLSLNRAADGIVHAEIFDLRILTAERASRVFGTADFSKFHLQGVIDQQAIGQGFSDAEDFLDRFRRLKNAHSPSEGAQDTGFLAIRNESSRWWFRVEAAVAGIACMGLDRRELAFEAEHAG